jgi:hypothetical protein
MFQAGEAGPTASPAFLFGADEFGPTMMEGVMRRLIAGCVLAAGALVVVAQAPSTQVRAEGQSFSEERAFSKRQASSEKRKPEAQAGQRSSDGSAKVDPAKEADIRQLMEVTGAKDLGQQLMEAGIAQFRASVTESQPDNPRAKQFADAFAQHFQKHFDPRALADTVIPIYDKHLSSEDLRELLAYYQSPFGQRMLKVLPEVARESQTAGFRLGQKAAEQAMEDLKPEYPEFVPNASEEEKHPATNK